jgi:hypothetical protein
VGVLKYLFLLIFLFSLSAGAVYFPQTTVVQSNSSNLLGESFTFDGAGNSIGSTSGALNSYLTNTSLSVSGNKTTLANGTDPSLEVRPVPETKFRTTFSKVQSGVDSTSFTNMQTGSGQTVNQSAGNLVLTTGTTANSETVLRSTQSFSDTVIFKWATVLSQRIANQNFFMELVDVIGDGLAVTVNSATSITVTIPSNPFTSVNVGQSMYVGVISGVSGAIPGRYAIASVSGNNVTFTVAGWPGSGSGTLSLFGWNYHQVVYNGTTATQAMYDAQRNGWNTGFTTATINTTASPGHLGIIQAEDSVASFQDQLVASSTTVQVTQRASRVQNLPNEGTPLYLQIRSLNGSTAPASTTTWTIGLTSVENYASSMVNISGQKIQSLNSAQSVQITNASLATTATISSGTVTNNAGVNTTANDLASVAKTATFVLAIAPTAGGAQSAAFQLNATVVTGTNPTLDCSILESEDNGATYSKVLYSFERVTGILATPLFTKLLRLSGNKFEYSCVIGGTTPSFTMALWRAGSPVSPGLNYSLYDRTMTPGTSSSPGATWFTEGCTSGQITYNETAATVSPVLTYQVSADGTNWANTSYTVTPANSAGTYLIPLPMMSSKYGRIFTTTGGTGVTYGYSNLQCSGF